MKHFVATSCILSLTLIAGGCATKKYVRNTTAPIQAKVDQVGDQAQKQGQEIQDTRSQLKTVDENAQSGISAAKERAMTAQQRADDANNSAQGAMSRANEVGMKADKTASDLDSLRTTVSNLDDYKLRAEITVAFRFNRYTLDDKAKEELDKLVSDTGNAKRYFIAVEGFTDRTGSAAYNEALSRKRADAVVQYMVAKHDVPIYRIHMIGLGKEKPVDTGRGRQASAKNRRVEIRVYSADQNNTSLSQLNQPTQ